MVNNNQIIIWPKGAPALFEVGLDSEGDNMRQLNNAEQTGADVYPLKVSSLCYSDFFGLLFLNSWTRQKAMALREHREGQLLFFS